MFIKRKQKVMDRVIRVCKEQNLENAENYK